MLSHADGWRASISMAGGPAQSESAPEWRGKGAAPAHACYIMDFVIETLNGRPTFDQAKVAVPADGLALPLALRYGR